MQIDDLKDKKIGILGLGVENESLLAWLLKHDVSNDITVCDEKDDLKFPCHSDRPKGAEESLSKKVRDPSTSHYRDVGRDDSEEFSKIKNTNQNVKIEYRTGENYLENLTDFDIVFRTPGIPYLSEEIQQAKKAGVEIYSTTKLFFDLCPAKIIGVTGTKGKGTTSTLIAEILKQNYSCHSDRPEGADLPANATHQALQAGESLSKVKGSLAEPALSEAEWARDDTAKIFLGGNIGRSPFEFLDEIKPDDIVVLELSSFQLQDLHKSPHIAVVLNITQEHLEIHKNREEYVDAKFNIVKNQTKDDFVVANIDYLTSTDFAENSLAHPVWVSTKKWVDEGSFVKKSPSHSDPALAGEESSRSADARSFAPSGGAQDDVVILRKNDKDIEICAAGELKLIGKHNLENVCPAVAVAGILDIDSKIIRETVINFRGLPHRLELIRELNNVRYFNDSIATTPETAIAATKAFLGNGIHLIVGGSSKNSDFSKLAEEITNDKNIKSLIFLGNDEARKIRKLVEEKIDDRKLFDANSMDEAVRLAQKNATSGDVVLLSPACASFDLFKNYKERGEAFRDVVSRLS